jgi:FkbM family methyltransferase
MSGIEHDSQPERRTAEPPGVAATVKYKDRLCYFDTRDIDFDKPGVIDACLLRGVFYEQRFLDYIASLKIKGTYLDVGACVGTHSVFFAMCCPADHVWAFEPREHQRHRLERTLELNDLFGKVTVSPWALSDERGTVTVNLDRRVHTLPTERLDRVVQGPVALIKIDVEGMEPRVLAGATGILRRHRPLVFAEAHTDEEFERILARLRPFGYVATGRVFNASPTYEFVVPPGPMERMRDRLQRPHLRRRVVRSVRRRAARRIRGLRRRVAARGDRRRAAARGDRR